MRSLVWFLVITILPISSLIAQKKFSFYAEGKVDFSVVDRKVSGDFIFEKKDIIPKLQIGVSYGTKHLVYSLGVRSYQRRLEYSLYKLLPGETISGYSFLAQREIRDYVISSHSRRLTSKYINFLAGVRYLKQLNDAVGLFVSIEAGPEIVIFKERRDTPQLPNRSEGLTIQKKANITSWLSHDVGFGTIQKIGTSWFLYPQIGYYSSNIQYQDMHLGFSLRTNFIF